MSDSGKDLQRKQILALDIMGKTAKEIAGVVRLDIRTVQKIQSSPQYKELSKEHSNEILTMVKSSLRSLLAQEVPELVRVIRKHLSEDNLEAVKVVLKTLGLDATEQQSQATSIQVLLPGQAETYRTIQTVEVEDASSSLPESSEPEVE